MTAALAGDAMRPAIGYVPYALTGWLARPPLFPGARGLGIALFVAALPLFVAFNLRFVFEGDGTPAPIAPTRHLIVVRPGEMPRVVDDLVSTMDLFPTLLELAGVTAPASDAVSLVPLLDGKAPARHPHRAFADARMRVWGWGGRQRAIREGDWKLIAYDWHWWPFDHLGLFDLRRDPFEHRNIAREEPQRVQALARLSTVRSPWQPPGRARPTPQRSTPT